MLAATVGGTLKILMLEVELPAQVTVQLLMTLKAVSLKEEETQPLGRALEQDCTPLSLLTLLL